MDALRFLFSPNGRAGRKAMLLVTVLFLLVSIVRGQLATQGAATLASVFLAFQLFLLWPAQIAVPVRRFHDMGRRARWVGILWGGAIVSLLFTHWGLTQTGPLVDMTAAQIWGGTEEYVARIAALNAEREEGQAIKLLNGPGMGGISLAMVFLLVQFGWLHFIPGTNGSNSFGDTPE